MAYWDEQTERRFAGPRDTPDDPETPEPFWLMALVMVLAAVGLMLAAGILH